MTDQYDAAVLVRETLQQALTDAVVDWQNGVPEATNKIKLSVDGEDFIITVMKHAYWETLVTEGFLVCLKLHVGQSRSMQ